MSRKKIIRNLWLVFVCLMSAHAFAQMPDTPSFYTENIDSVPDLMQTDPNADFPGGGTEYCCLVAIANSLMWLDVHGFPDLVVNTKSQFDDEVKLAKRLGSGDYMNTDLDEGTGTTNIMRGLKKYIQDCGYQMDRLEFQGWRKHPDEMKTRQPVPQLDWIKRGILDNGAVWLNVGWYKQDPSKNQYTRIAGHWVTLVGYGKDQEGKLDPGILIVHDPSPRAGRDFSNEYARAERIDRGSLAGEWAGLPRSAVGYYKLGGGMHIKKGADTAIIDGVIALKLKPKIGGPGKKQSGQAAPEPAPAPEGKSNAGQAGEKLENARALLKANPKKTTEAYGILVDLAQQDTASLTAVQLCYVYVYLGYIEDLASNRSAAVGWFKKGCELQAAKTDGIYKVAEQGLTKPVTRIRHLDGATVSPGIAPPERTGANKGIVQKISGGVVSKDEPTDAGTPDMDLSPAQRLENFDILAEAIDKHYSFFAYKKIDWPQVTARYRRMVETTKTNGEFYLLMYQFVRELKDAHSWLCNYKSVPQLGEFSPLMHTRLVEGKLIVTEVVKDSEAYINGLRPGAVIVGVDGMAVKEKVEKNRPLMRMVSSERCFQEQAYRKILNGNQGSLVSIRFTAPGETAPKIVRLKRVATGKEMVIESDFQVNKSQFIWDGIHPSGYGYIRIVSFEGHQEIADEFDLAMERMKNTPGLLIDIRENPGGFGAAQKRIIGRLITARTKVDIAYAKNGPGHEDFSMNEGFVVPAGSWQYTKPVALLINAITGSASDLFACRMISTGRPITVGSGTHGNSTGTCVFVRLPCNLVVRVSAGYICDTTGRIIEGNGNAPNIHAEPTMADILTGSDSVIDVAVKALRNSK